MQKQELTEEKRNLDLQRQDLKKMWQEINDGLEVLKRIDSEK